MPKVDPALLPYGALHYYQVHYIVQVESQENGNFLAKCEPKTRVHFGNERVVEVKWTGVDGFANILQGDAKLTEMLKEVMLHEGEIRRTTIFGSMASGNSRRTFRSTRT
jgi:hypothetical protein